jgi:outer membrane protein
MKKYLAIAMASMAALVSTGVAAQQAESPYLVRIRAVDILPVNKSTDPTGTLGTNTIHVSNKWIPEIDGTYFFTKNIAAELILTYPQKHNVTLNGTNIGSFKHLPPTLTVQYHFLPDGKFRPYVGAGLNYTRISNVNLLGGAGSLNNSSWGGALQAGIDVKVSEHGFINFDIKKVYIKTDVMVNGSKVSTLNLDPVLVGVGYGYRF